MTKNKKSGNQRVISGGLHLLWEEVKTLNTNKIKAIYNIARGKVSLKLKKRGQKHHSTDYERDEFSPW